MIEDGKDISLEELAYKEWLSVRATNICQKHGLLSLTQLLDFYREKGSFMKLRNCGKNTENELIALCEKYKKQTIIVENKLKDDTVSLIRELNPLKRSTLNRHVEYLISNLSVRAANGIKNISKSGSIREILEFIYEPEFNFKTLHNIGFKTVEELKNFKNKISHFLNYLTKLKNEELSKEYAKLVVKTTFKDLPNNFEAEFERVLDASGKIKLFRLIDLLIESDQLFNQTEKRVFLGMYSSRDGNEESLKSIGLDLTLTNERIRQLKSILQEDLQSRFLFISNFIADDFVNYEIETLSSLKIIDETFTEKIKLNEEVNFNTLFCASILGIFLKKTHSILGDDEYIVGKRKIKGKTKFKCCYLISKNLFEVFDFELFIESISTQLSERISESYYLHFEGFLLQFINEKQRHLLYEIVPICEKIILNEFDMVVNFDGCIVFERNTKKLISEYAFEILEENGKMMKVEDIYTAINNKYSELATTDQSVRAALQREKELFIFFGRSSTYGLRKWEYEKDDIKGGTIRDIVEEYLQLEMEPKHISEILKYIQKYRKTNERNVMTNIEAEDNNRFRFFDGDFVGLKSKSYGLETLNFKRVVGAHFISKRLAKFNGVDLDKVVEHYVKKYGYAHIQVRYLLEKKVADGYIKITNDNKLKI